MIIFQQIVKIASSDVPPVLIKILVKAVKEIGKIHLHVFAQVDILMIMCLPLASLALLNV